jgi:hypothetical protein
MEGTRKGVGKFIPPLKVDSDSRRGVHQISGGALHILDALRPFLDDYLYLSGCFSSSSSIKEVPLSSCWTFERQPDDAFLKILLAHELAILPIQSPAASEFNVSWSTGIVADQESLLGRLFTRHHFGTSDCSGFLELMSSALDELS